MINENYIQKRRTVCNLNIFHFTFLPTEKNDNILTTKQTTTKTIENSTKNDG